MRAAFVLFALAALARAQDELFETVWIVGQDGELLGWPDPEAGDAATAGGDLKPFRVFGSGADACLEPLCAWGWGLLLVPGPSDLVSLCDPERHLRKTNQNVFDEWLLMGINREWMAETRSDPAKRRMFLDALLGWRVLGARGCKEAASQLASVAADPRVDRITRSAAADLVAQLDGRMSPTIDLPPLDGIPADADVIAVVDQRRIPPWRDIWRVHNAWAIREARRLMARVGGAVTPMDICSAQWVLDREWEAFYELARRFGNARVHRTVLALRWVEQMPVEFLVKAEGLFEFDRFATGCVDAGVKTQPRTDSTTAGLEGATVFMTGDQLQVSKGDWRPAGKGIPEDLASLGLGGDDAIWIHCRRVPFAEELPVKGIETLTLRASFDGGVALRCRATFKDVAAAKAAAAEMETWKSLALEPATVLGMPFRNVDPAHIARVKAFLASIKVSVDGTTVTAECTAKGETPESLLEGVVDLEAIYTPIGND